MALAITPARATTSSILSGPPIMSSILQPKPSRKGKIKRLLFFAHPMPKSTVARSRSSEPSASRRNSENGVRAHGAGVDEAEPDPLAPLRQERLSLCCGVGFAVGVHRVVGRFVCAVAHHRAHPPRCIIPRPPVPRMVSIMPPQPCSGGLRHRRGRRPVAPSSSTSIRKAGRSSGFTGPRSVRSPVEHYGRRSWRTASRSTPTAGRSAGPFPT